MKPSFESNRIIFSLCWLTGNGRDAQTSTKYHGIVTAAHMNSYQSCVIQTPTCNRLKWHTHLPLAGALNCARISFGRCQKVYSVCLVLSSDMRLDSRFDHVELSMNPKCERRLGTYAKRKHEHSQDADGRREHMNVFSHKTPKPHACHIFSGVS